MTDTDLEWHTWPPRTGGQQAGLVGCGVIVIHKPTGLAAVSTDERSQMRNRERARGILMAVLDEKHKHRASE